MVFRRTRGWVALHLSRVRRVGIKGRGEGGSAGGILCDGIQGQEIGSTWVRGRVRWWLLAGLSWIVSLGVNGRKSGTFQHV